MNNNTLYTRCPTCSTAFKVTDSLLSMAKGKVRCGACLAIFQATDYMLEPKNHPTDSSADKALDSESQPPKSSSFATEKAAQDELSLTDEPQPDEQEPRSEVNDKVTSEESEKFEALPDFNPDALTSNDEISQLDAAKENNAQEEPEWSLPEPEQPESRHEQLDFESLAVNADDQKTNDVSDTNAGQPEATDSPNANSPEPEQVEEKQLEAARTEEFDSGEESRASLDGANEAPIEEGWGNTRDEHLSESQLLPEPSMMFEEAEQSSQIDTDREEPKVSDQGLDHAAVNQTDETFIDVAEGRTEDSVDQQLEEAIALDGATDDPSIDSLLDDALLDLDESESIVTSDDNINESPLDASSSSANEDEGHLNEDEDHFNDDLIEPLELDTDPIIDESIVSEGVQDSNDPDTNEFEEGEFESAEVDAGSFASDDFDADDVDAGSFDSDDFDAEVYNELDESQFDAEDFSDELSTQLTDQMAETDASPDPLDEFDEIVNESNSGIKGKLIGLSVLILLIIGFQQVWSNRQTLAWSNTWGSSVKAVCGFLPCDLKARRDVSKIRLLQRQVAPDENQEDMLDVKVLLVNEADFDQPYPTIKITFTNTNSETVAVKTFPASSYLNSDAKDELMPSRTEVHIHFKSEAQTDGFGFEFSFE